MGITNAESLQETTVPKFLWLHLLAKACKVSASVRYVQTPKDGNANEETLLPLLVPSGL